MLQLCLCMRAQGCCTSCIFRDNATAVPGFAWCHSPADDEDAKKAIKVAKDKLPTSSGRTKARGRDKSSVDKQPKTLLQKINFFLFGWADSTFKVNGKKLMPHNVMLWRFMVSLPASCA